MKLSGFTFVRNAIKYGYPVEASIRSLLPLVDEMIVCVGKSEDDTEALIRSINSEKIRIVNTVWDENLKQGGAVLAEETNKAMDATAADSDWLFYIQADEVLHEQDHDTIRQAMLRYLEDKKVEGLLFNYLHFYGSYRYIGDGRKWYSKEIRVIRNDKQIRSYLDAQGFRWKDGRKLNVKLIDANIHHYGWVRNPLKMFQKLKEVGKLWGGNDDQGKETGLKTAERYDYSNIDSVTAFKGTHPAVMESLVKQEDWDADLEISRKKFKNSKHRLLYFLWKTFGWRPFEYSNYKRI